MRSSFSLEGSVHQSRCLEVPKPLAYTRAESTADVTSACHSRVLCWSTVGEWGAALDLAGVPDPVSSSPNQSEQACDDTMKPEVVGPDWVTRLAAGPPKPSTRPADPCPVLSLAPGQSGPLHHMLTCGRTRTLAVCGWPL